MENSDNQTIVNRNRRVFRNHLLAMIDEVEHYDISWRNADGFTQQVKSIRKEAVSLFSHDISTYIPPFDDAYIGNSYTDSTAYHAKSRIVQIHATLRGLLDYCNSMMGDPVSQGIIDDYLMQAVSVLNDEKEKHPAILASVFIRVSLEQSLKSLCNINDIPYGKGERATNLNSKLQNKNVYPKYIMDEIDQKLKLLNGVIHSDPEQPPLNKIREALDWSNKFIYQYLPAPMGDG